MKNLWHRLRDDESGFVVSSELVIVGTVGVLGMVVGLDAISSSVNQELNDLASAFGAMNQSYNYRSIAKSWHARVSGSGFNDRGDFCDCTPIVQTDVVGKSDASGSFSETFIAPPVVREQIVQPSVVPPMPVPKSVISVPCPTPCSDQLGEIIEERIIRRRANSSSDYGSTVIVPHPEFVVPPPQPTLKFETTEPKPKRKKD